MTARVVSLESKEAGDARMGGTVAERLAAVAELTELGWTLAKLPRPSYTRATMPVVVTTLGAHDTDGQSGVNDDFRDMLAALVAEGAKFLVVGAHALAVHGVPRMTGDLDVFVEPTPENAGRVWRALARFGAPLDSLKVRESDFCVANTVAQFGVPPYRIDVMTTISGVGFEEAWRDRIEDSMLGVKVPFLGRESFIRNKRASGRKKDLGDIEALEG